MNEIKIPKAQIIPELTEMLKANLKEAEPVIGKVIVEKVTWTLEGITIKIEKVKNNGTD